MLISRANLHHKIVCKSEESKFYEDNILNISCDVYKVHMIVL